MTEYGQSNPVGIENSPQWQAANAKKNVTGIENPADWMGDVKFGEAGNNAKTGKWQQYVDSKISDPTVKQEMMSQVQELFTKYPDMSPTELKYRLRSVENRLKQKYPKAVPRNFDISGKMLDKTLAKELLGSNITQAKPNTSDRPNDTMPDKPQTPKPLVQSVSNGLQDEEAAAFKRIKSAQASDADLALFNKYSDEELQKMGFGPKSIAAIKATAKQANAPKKSVSPLSEKDMKAAAIERINSGKYTPDDLAYLAGSNDKILQKWGISSEGIKAIRDYEKSLPGYNTWAQKYRGKDYVTKDFVKANEDQRLKQNIVKSEDAAVKSMQESEQATRAEPDKKVARDEKRVRILTRQYNKLYAQRDATNDKEEKHAITLEMAEVYKKIKSFGGIVND